jgi:hypothetical protein
MKKHAKANDEWYYIDKQKKSQGPFRSLQMDIWYLDQHFEPTLQISNNCCYSFQPLMNIVTQAMRLYEMTVMPPFHAQRLNQQHGHGHPRQGHQPHPMHPGHPGQPGFPMRPGGPPPPMPHHMQPLPGAIPIRWNPTMPPNGTMPMQLNGLTEKAMKSMLGVPDDEAQQPPAFDYANEFPALNESPNGNGGLIPNPNSKHG